MSDDLRARLEAHADERSVVRDVSVTGAALGGAALFDLRADAVDLPDADLRDAAFDGAHLTDCGLGGARLDGASFARAHLWQCDLRRTRGDGVRFCEAHIEAGFFQGAALARADFDGARLADVRFDGAALARATFRGATLDGVRFDSADLTGADFRGARVGEVSFAGADLTGADFRGARVGEVSFAGARGAGALFDDEVEAPPAPSESPPDAEPCPARLAATLTEAVVPALAPDDRATVTEGLTALLAAAPARERAELARLLDGSPTAEPWPAELRALVAEIQRLPGDRPSQVAHAARVLLARLSAQAPPADALQAMLPPPTGRAPESDEARAARLRREADAAIAAAMRAAGLDQD